MLAMSYFGEGSEQKGRDYQENGAENSDSGLEFRSLSSLKKGNCSLVF